MKPKELKVTLEDMQEAIEDLEWDRDRLVTEAKKRAAQFPSIEGDMYFMDSFLHLLVRELLHSKAIDARRFLVGLARWESAWRNRDTGSEMDHVAFVGAADSFLEMRRLVKDEIGLIVPDGTGLNLEPLSSPSDENS